MSRRLELLERITRAGQGDSFAWYGLAMEYRSLGRIADALDTFTALRERDADYVPMYLMAGQMLTEADRAGEARQWLEQGLLKARARGEAKAASEIEAALHALGSPGDV